jgi:dTDP-4-dehydrorhamnose reductase
MSTPANAWVLSRPRAKLMSRAGTILVIGKAGQVARCLALSADQQKILLLSVGRPELDITSTDSIDRIVDKIMPACIINAAAYTAVDKAETESEAAYRVNFTGAAHLAKASAKGNVPLIHISTDYVFDGRGSSPYRESDATSPLGVYGHSKRDGELEVLSAHPGALVVRTSWVYSAFGTNFLKTMARLAETHPVVRVVADQHGSPTSALALAPALLNVAAQLSDPATSKPGGIYHLTATGETTWFGFAQAIFDSLKSRGERVPDAQPISTAEYPAPAKRPAYSVLDCAKMERTFGVRLPPWRQSLDPCLDQFARQKELQPC